MPPIRQLFSSVTNQLVLICVLTFFATQLFSPNQYTGFEMYSWDTAYFKPWQIVTSMFLHGGVSHLLFNMVALWMFGRVLERVLGKQRFLIFYLACGIGAAIIQQLVRLYVLHDETLLISVGASGAVYGLLVAFALMFPNFKIMLIFLPVPIAAKYFVPALLTLDIIGGFTGHSIFGQNIGHFAHIGGALTGFVLLMFWLKKASNRQE